MALPGSSPTDLSVDELAAVAGRIAAAGVSVAGPLAAELIAGGRSNLTYLLSDGTSRWVMRTPPRAGRTPSAHDVVREYRVTAALGATDVPVARAVALCEDDTILGGPFAVADYVPGRTVRTRAQLDELGDDEVDAVAAELVEVLARLHRVDHVAVGLEGFGRPAGYAQRQLKRWAGQWDLVGATELGPLAGELRSGLSRAMPEQRRSGIVHGDYRIDNTVLDLDGEQPRIAAVVDWEMSTIGDPVADVALMCAYRHPAFDLILGAPSAWTSDRLPEPSALAGAYEAAGGVRLEHWGFHLALAFFKIAVIAAGIDHRFRAGATSGEGFETAGSSVETYLELGLSSLGGRQ